MYYFLRALTANFKSSPFTFLLILLLSNPFYALVPSLKAATLVVNVISGTDDAEDKGGTFNDTDDTVLNIGESDSDGAGHIGLRFQNISIPRGSIITNAYITFTSNGNQGNNPSDAVIYAEDSSSPNAYNGTTLIRLRPKTSTSIAWSDIPDWSSGRNYNTPNLSSLIQSVINRNDWASGNSIAFIIQNLSINARRPAKSFENTNKVLQLTIEYTPLSFSINDVTLQEGNSGYGNMNFTITLSNSADTNVSYAASNGTALAGSDYNATSGTLSFTSGGPTTQIVSVPIVGDTVFEPNETFTLTLSNPIGATISDANATGTIVNDDVLLSYCDDQNLSDGFHIANPFNDSNKSIEIYCYNDKDYIALPIKNDSNNFVFKTDTLTTTHYYNQARDNGNHFDAIEINAYTLEVESNSSIRLPQTISALPPFQTMGSSFSNINLTGTPFAIDWANTTISNCTQSKLRTGYFGQVVKINTLDYDNKAICNIDKMKLKLLDDYRYLEYENNEVLEKSCKTMAEAVPTTFLASSAIKGHYWISPFSNERAYNQTNIKSDNRPIVAYCWYQTDLDWVWTFSLAMDGKVTNSKNDLVSKSDTCSEFGLVPFVPNREDTFERVRQFLYDNKAQWDKYTGTINEKVNLFMGGSYYLSSEQNSPIWPYGSFGVYFPYSGNTPQGWRGSNDTNPGWMSGSPMHNIPSITYDYDRFGEFYSYGRYSNTDAIATPTNVYEYKDTMGAKGWVSILGSQDLNVTNEWFISRTGAGENIIGTTVYFEPNGNYTANAWLNFLFDSNGRVRHNDDWNANYAYYDYMCMAEDNYDFTTRYGLVVGPFKAIERSVASGTEASNTSIQTKIVEGDILLDIAILNDELTALSPDRNVSVGIFMNDTYMVGSTETPRDIHYFGDIKRDGTGSFNALKSTGRFQIPSANWPSGNAKWSSANKRLFVKFKYCSIDSLEWTDCWTPSGNGAVCTPGQESYCKSVDSDDFAVRPNAFDLDITGTAPYKAGVGYPMNFSAENFIGTASADYNESVPFTYFETKAGCLSGDFNESLSAISMIDGAKTMNLSYDQVGVINLILQETLGSEFAKIDSDDTPDTTRLITPYEQNISFTPDHFSLTGTTFNNFDQNFTYVSDDLNMSADLNLSIQAQALDNTVTSNYNSACYAKDTNATIAYSTITLTPPNGLTQLLFLETNTSTSGNVALNTTLAINDINETIFGTDNNGTGKMNIKLNFNRNPLIPINPFSMTITNIGIVDQDSINGTTTLNQNATFYYGRTHAPNYRFSGNSGTATIYYEVYAKDLNATQRQAFGITGAQGVDSVDWYQNALHVNTNEGTYYQSTPTALVSGITLGTPALNTLGLSATPPHSNQITFGSHPWLNHYPQNFNVEFYTSGAWAGEGSVDRNASSANVGEHTNDQNITRTNRRLNW